MPPTKLQDNALKRVEERLDEMATSKISKDYAISEITNLKESVKRIDSDLDNLEVKAGECTQTGVFKTIGKRVDDVTLVISQNTNSILRLYKWQAGIGIALLLFFLTVGIAALVYVSDIGHGVEVNTQSIQRIEAKINKEDEAQREELRDLITDTIIEAQKPSSSP